MVMISHRRTSAAARHRTLHFHLLPALLLAAAASGAAVAQTADVARGRRLFEQTPAETGIQSLQNCRDCHNAAFINPNLDPVAERRRAIGGELFPNITPALARTRIGVGLNQSDMAQFRTTLDSQDLDDLAAYIADTPKTSASSLELSAPAVQGTDNAVFTLSHSAATTFPLVVNTVTVSGAGAASYVASGCAGQTLNAGNQCTVLVQFTASDTARKNAQVLVSLTQQNVNFTRAVSVTGGVTGVTPPPDGGGGGGLNPGGGGGEGGGALAWGWLAALLAAAAAARRVGRGAAV
jgi:cytochrome c553